MALAAWILIRLGCCLQESEGEEAMEAKVDLAQDMGRGNLASRQSRVRLQEVRPCAYTCWGCPQAVKRD